MVERRHGGVGPLEELWHPEQLTCDGCGWEVPCWWHAPGARRISSLALYACRQHSLHGWPLVCAFRRGREERQFLYVLYFVFFIVIVIATVGSTDLCPHQRSNVRLARGCAPRSVRSCVAHFYSTGSRCWCGSGGNGAGREPTAWKEGKTEGQDENYEEANCGEAGSLRRP